MLAVRN